MGKSERIRRLEHAMNRVMPTCEDVTHLVSAGMDERLSLRDHLRVRIHLLFCRWCRAFQSQLEFIRHLLAEDRVVAGDDDTIAERLSPDAKAKLQEAIARQQ